MNIKIARQKYNFKHALKNTDLILKMIKKGQNISFQSPYKVSIGTDLVLVVPRNNNYSTQTPVSLFFWKITKCLSSKLELLTSFIERRNWKLELFKIRIHVELMNERNGQRCFILSPNQSFFRIVQSSFLHSVWSEFDCRRKENIEWLPKKRYIEHLD